MKKIAVISNGLSGGGAERVASILANYFDDKGYSVLFVAAYSPDKEYRLNDDVQYAYIDVKSTNSMLRLIERSRKLTRTIKSFGADVVFTFVTDELIPLSLSKIKVIPSLRIDPKSIEGKRVKRIIREFVYHHAYRIVFQTEQARDYYDDSIIKKGVIIGNPITANLPYWNTDSHSNYFMTACRISKQKNIPMLINAFCRFHDIHPDYTLDIYGDGEPAEYKQQMIDYAASKGASDYIRFMGHSTEIHSLMQNAQGFLLTSDFEGLSNSMLEAMAIGVPAICTDCPPGGAKKYIDHEKSGMLVPVGGEDETFDALCKLVESKDLQKTISSNSRYVRDILSTEAICEQWEDLI